MLTTLCYCMSVLTVICSSVASQSVCQNQNSCQCKYDCSIKPNWLCGDDGKTYLNGCILNQTRCELKEVVLVNHTGQCMRNGDDARRGDSIDVCSSIVCGLGMRCKAGGHQKQPMCVCSNLCLPTTNEVCGSDNVTYQNVCYMRALACKRGQDVFVTKTGSCYKPSSDTCLKKKCPFGVCKISPGKRAQCVCWSRTCVRDVKMCGTDRITYPSLCHLMQQSCRRKTNTQVAYPGDCLTDRQLCKDAKCRDSCEVQNGKARCFCKDKCGKSERNYVCGDNGKTYFNMCQLRLGECRSDKRIRIAYKGRCPRDSCRGIECGPGRKCVSVGSASLCKCDNSKCPKRGPKVCGSNNVTYKSHCHMDFDSCKSGFSLTVARPGSCNHCLYVKCAERQKCVEKDDRGLCICTRDGCDPNPPLNSTVCGSNGITYRSKCLLKYERCRSGRNISVLYKGNCSRNCGCKFGASCVIREQQRECRCLFNCTQSPWSPVCASVGDSDRSQKNKKYTYPNNCTVQSVACENRTRMVVLHDRPCESSCSDVSCGVGKECVMKHNKPRCICKRNCSKTVGKVCGSDGKTYASVCTLTAKACKRDLNVTVRHVGGCRPKLEDLCANMNCSKQQYCRVHSNKAECVCVIKCASNGPPVCGTNSQTYDSQCVLELAVCKGNKQLRVLHEGYCLNTYGNVSEADECARCQEEGLRTSRQKTCSSDIFVAVVRIADRLALNLDPLSLTSQYNVTVLSVFKQPLTGKVETGPQVLHMNGRVQNCHCPLDNRESNTFIIGGRLQTQSGELSIDQRGFVRVNSPVEFGLWKLVTLLPQAHHCA